MEEFALIETRTINNALVDGFYNNEQAWFTRIQIGEALGYDDPKRQVAKIHNRHRNRLDALSRVVKLTTLDGKQREAFLYSIRGVLEICRWSKQPKADEVMDALYDMAESVYKKGYFSCMSDNDLLQLLIDKCLTTPSLESRLNKNSISGLKKLRLREENESARYIIGEYNRKCKALRKYYESHGDEQGLEEELRKCTQGALDELREQCPHLEVIEPNESTLSIKVKKLTEV